ncbi:PAS domain S-box-containing protein [Verrucomicrobium sp. GAS474]|uniref:ATP-binding protein n=1 Tax=Verrucomicrobium sp. GAS474 TaxID=1882831 RepID=UPI000879634E|nr:ATP-binding protein [Verrucomicrobium sp. GAS474]SDU07043.1 PAS domain S-box-containing protein [Verrucomicrobium sp. GAS474]
MSAIAPASVFPPRPPRIPAWRIFFWVAGGIGLLLLLLGITVMVGWHFGIKELVQIRPDYPQMQYLTALVFLLSGMGLLALLGEWRRVASVIGAFVCWIGLAVLSEALLGTLFPINRWIDFLPALPNGYHGRPAPVTAFCWIVMGGLFMITGSSRVPKAVRSPLVWLGAMVILFVCLLKLMSYFVGFVSLYTWGNYIGMAFHTAWGLVLFGIAILAVEMNLEGRRGEAGLLHSRWLPLLTGAASALSVILVWEGLRIDHYHQMEAKARLVAETLKLQIVERVNARIQEIDRIALRWEERNGTPRDEWESDATRHTGALESFLAIEWIDVAGRLRWAVPTTGAQKAGGKVVGEVGFWNAAPALERARRDRCMVFSPTVDLMLGGRGFLVYRPLFPAKGFDGFIVAVLRTGDLFHGVFSSAGFSAYSVAICEEDEPVYLSTGFAEAIESVQAQATLDFCGHQWVLTVSPTTAMEEEAGGGLPRLILFLGLGFSLALAFSVRAFQQARAKTAVADAARERLQREIVERRRIEEQLRHSEEQYRFMVNNVKDYAIFLLDATGHAVSWNPGVAQIKGYSEGEFLGKHISVFYRPDDIAEGKPERGLKIAEETGRYEDEGWRIRKDGTPFWAVVTINALRDDDGRLLGFTKFTHDLTDKKNVEDQLREESRKAQEANRLKGEFLTNMTHELRTPLNAIIGFSQFLAGETPGPLNDKQKEFLRDVEASGKHLLRLINEILDLAKIEAGKLELSIESFSVKALVEEVTGVLRPLLTEKGLIVETEFSMGDDQVALDLLKIRQALYNLLSNAIKFTDSGGRIFVQAQAAEAGFFEIRVSDTGLGIKKEDFSRLFVEFQQLDSGASRNYPGTGLGLVLVKKIVEGHGGRVEVASDYGHGTTFSIILPRLYKKATDPAKARENP